MKLIAALAFCILMASCAAPPRKPTPIATPYRYENTLNLLGGLGPLMHVLVIGYDDAGIGEATRLVVSAGGRPLTLRNQIDVNGAMYTPAVELSKTGNLLVRWGVIDDGSEEVELAADPDGNLSVVKRISR